MKVFMLWIALVISDTAAQLMLKWGAVQMHPAAYELNYQIITGYALYLLSFLIWMQILKFTKLYIALAAASVVFITIALGSHYFLGESITFNTLVGTVCVASGVFLIGLTKPE